MIGEGLWKRRFGGDPSIVGTHITLNGVDSTVVGIAPASLALLSNGDLWIPMTIDPGRENQVEPCDSSRWGACARGPRSRRRRRR